MYDGSVYNVTLVQWLPLYLTAVVHAEQRQVTLIALVFFKPSSRHNLHHFYTFSIILEYLKVHIIVSIFHRYCRYSVGITVEYFDQLLSAVRQVHVVYLAQLLGAVLFIHIISNHDNIKTKTIQKLFIKMLNIIV